MASMLGPDIDSASASLIIQLQREDVELYFSSSKGKTREPTSEEQAFRMQDEELKAVSAMLPNQRVAESVAATVQLDGQTSTNNIAQEETASHDRHIVRRRTEDEVPAIKEKTRPSPDTSVSLVDELRMLCLKIDFIGVMFDSIILEAKLKFEHKNKSSTLASQQVPRRTFPDFDAGFIDTSSEEHETGESSAWAAQPAPKRILRRCIACREEMEFFHVVRVPCGHDYCRSCLEQLFKASMADETIFPPKCCGELIAIFEDSPRVFLNSDLAKKYEEKKVEFETPNRTYCHNPECSSFIPMAYIEDEIAPCFECGSTTCTICKAKSHAGDCPSDTATQQLLDIAQENGWRRCRVCKRMIELDHGCNHMTLVSQSFFPFFFFPNIEADAYKGLHRCRCGAQFCYECGKQWKTCLCPRWSENLLVARRPRREINPEQVPLVAADPLLVLYDELEDAVALLVNEEAATLAAMPRVITPDITENDDAIVPPVIAEAATLAATTPPTTPDIHEDENVQRKLQRCNQCGKFKF